MRRTSSIASCNIPASTVSFPPSDHNLSIGQQLVGINSLWYGHGVLLFLKVFQPSAGKCSSSCCREQSGQLAWVSDTLRRTCQGRSVFTAVLVPPLNVESPPGAACIIPVIASSFPRHTAKLVYRCISISIRRFWRSAKLRQFKHKIVDLPKKFSCHIIHNSLFFIHVKSIHINGHV